VKSFRGELAVCFLSWLSLASFAVGAPGKGATKYPHIVEVSGKVTWTDRNGKTSAAKKNQVLIEKAAIETAGSGRAKVQLDAHRLVELFPDSRLEIPAISWETGEAPMVSLKSGTLRWLQATKGTYNIALTSELFEFIPPIGDYVFSFDPKAAIAEVKVVEGKISFSAMHAEDTAEVQAGQKCQFQGVKENGEIVYDVLLQGKKIPRGRLGNVQTFTSEEKRQYSAQTVKKKAVVAAQKKKAAEVAQKAARDPSQICAAPVARLNQCAWICTGNPAKEKKICHFEKPEVRCVRKRCNANGEWAEATEIPQEKAQALCSATPRVQECDY
jgi:hypothetical protein